MKTPVAILSVDTTNPTERGYFRKSEMMTAGNLWPDVDTSITKLGSAAEIQDRSPSAFGLFGVVLDGVLVGHQCLLEREVVAFTDARA